MYLSNIQFLRELTAEQLRDDLVPFLYEEDMDRKRLCNETTMHTQL